MIVITDNAAGIHNADLTRAFRMSEKAENTSGMHVHTHRRRI